MSNLATNPVNFNDENEVKEWLDNIEVEYHYGCYRDKESDMCYRYGEYMQNIRNDFTKAAEAYKHGCEEYKNHMCCYRLAQFMQLGKGKLEKDDVKATELYKQSCDTKPSGDRGKDLRIANACGSFAMMLTVNHASRKKILDKMTENDENFNLVETVLTSLKRSCNLDDVIGCNMLSQFYMSGFPIEGKATREADFKGGSKYAEKACDLGCAQACNNLAVMYSRGDGVEQDFKKQKYYLDKCEEFTKGSFSMGFGKTK